ncbi:hypothetical protein MMC25_002969 [Agyrium rufum]|nr:hypothetical protein [Agyrium rufum]
MLVFSYLQDDLSGLIEGGLPLSVTKKTLRKVWKGLAELHSAGTVHTDVSPDNILIDWTEANGSLTSKRVALIDLEDAVLTGSKPSSNDPRSSDYRWQSPEASALGKLDRYSDMFSFGFFVTKKAIFAIPEEELGNRFALQLVTVVDTQLSYFADPGDLVTLLAQLDENPRAQMFRDRAEQFRSGLIPRYPVASWPGFDDNFKTFIAGLTSFDPRKRMSAKQALQHRWLAGAEDAGRLSTLAELACSL